jgi:hypothetical protein
MRFTQSLKLPHPFLLPEWLSVCAFLHVFAQKKKEKNNVEYISQVLLLLLF